MIADGLKLTGVLTIRLIGADGVEKERHVVRNTVTTAGKQGAADQLLASPSLGKPTHMAIGTGTPGATALGTEVARSALTSKSRSGAVVTAIGDFAAGTGTGTITEVALFDASSSGNMWSSATSFSTIKGATDALQISYALTQT